MVLDYTVIKLTDVTTRFPSSTLLLHYSVWFHYADPTQTRQVGTSSKKEARNTEYKKKRSKQDLFKFAGNFISSNHAIKFFVMTGLTSNMME